MSPDIITAIPTKNSGEFLYQTLLSLVDSTMKPKSVFICDNGSTDDTREIANAFKSKLPLKIADYSGPRRLFEAFNTCLNFAPACDYLHILHADDLVKPGFYAVMVDALADYPGRGIAWCLDERIDATGALLSVSGRATGKNVVLSRDRFLKRKAELGNQAFCATLLRTAYAPPPAWFPSHMAILGDFLFWGLYGDVCGRIVHVQRSLAQYRWHYGNATHAAWTDDPVQSLVWDEYNVMQRLEMIRTGRPVSLCRRLKFKAILSVRAAVKARRLAATGETDVAIAIKRGTVKITGEPIWSAGVALAGLRDVWHWNRRRHPANIFS